MTTLPLFWHLSSPSKKERLDASVKLIGALEQFQAQFVPKPEVEISDSEDENGEGEGGEPFKSDGLDALNAQDVSYSIRRLVRGLASPRESSRLGFAVALTELLSRINTVTCSQIVLLILDGTKDHGSMTGQEERDVLFARLFGLTSVIQSGLLVRAGSLEASGSSTTQVSTLASYEEVLQALLALGERKSWLRESAWWGIALAVEALEHTRIPWKKEALEATLRQLFEEIENWSPEKIALALKLQASLPEYDWRLVFAPVFKNPDLFHSGNLQSLARILKESAEEDGTMHAHKASAASWKPELHFVWDIILDHLLPGPNSLNSSYGSFQDFFRVVVDESLFSSTSSDARKYWGFEVFQKALTRVAQDTVPMLFTKNFMRSWINHLSHQDRYLHRIAKQTANEVQLFVQSNPQCGFALILQLTGVNGNQQFDKLTNTKIVENVLASMNIEGINQYIAYLILQANLPKKHDTSPADVQALNARRLWIVEQFGALIRNGKVPKDDQWILTILDWLVLHGLFLTKKKSEKSSYQGLHSTPNPAYSDIFRQACRSRLLACLADLTSQTTIVKSGEKSLKIAAVSSDGEFWVSKVLDTVQTLQKDVKHVSLLVSLKKEHLSPRVKALKLAERLKNISDTSGTLKGLRLLLLAIALQHYCDGESDTDNFNLRTLEASIEGVSEMFPENGQQPRKSTPTETTPDPFDLVVDTIIGFLEKSTAYLRTIGNQVFALLSASVKESTVSLIISQLERRDPADLAKDVDSSEENEDEESAQDETGEDDEEPDSEGNEESSESEEHDDDEETDVELRSKIEEALMANDTETVAGDTDDEELMDDDEMMAIDEQLVAAFRSRANEKTGKERSIQREATHFKNRVLDLVDIFVKNQSTNPLVLRFIPPLVDLIAGSSKDERQLSDKAKGILRSRIGTSKEVPAHVDLDLAQTILEDLHSRARKMHSSELLPTLSNGSLYISKILFQQDAGFTVVDIYRRSLQDFLTRKNSVLNASFFQEFIQHHPTGAWSLRTDLVELSAQAVNAYRQCQAYQLLEFLLSRLSSLKTHLSEVPEFMNLLSHALLKVAVSACQEKLAFSAAQLKQLLKLALVAARSTHKVNPSIVEECWEADSWHTLAIQLETSPRFKNSRGLREMSEQISRLSKTETSTTKKRKADGERQKLPLTELKRKKVVLGLQ